MDDAHEGPGDLEPQDFDDAPVETAPELTGHPVVDEVLASLTDLDQLASAERVGHFESAHAQLRDALADAGADD